MTNLRRGHKKHADLGVPTSAWHPMLECHPPGLGEGERIVAGNFGWGGAVRRILASVCADECGTGFSRVCAADDREGFRCEPAYLYDRLCGGFSLGFG